VKKLKTKYEIEPAQDSVRSIELLHACDGCDRFAQLESEFAESGQRSLIGSSGSQQPKYVRSGRSFQTH